MKEAKTLWALCIFFLTYCLTHSSNSMWMNLPMAVLILCGLRILLNQNEFIREVRPDPRQSRLNDAPLSTTPPSPRSEKKIDRPGAEAAINDFVDKIIDDFVKDPWSRITPDKELHELIRGVIMNAVDEISVRVKEMNIVDLLRDMVNLIGDHLDSFRRNQPAKDTEFVKIFSRLSSEKRDESLKRHLMASRELYPALISEKSEYKVLQKIVAGILSVVLRPRGSQSPIVETIVRELLTCLVFQPLVKFASPKRINEGIEQFSINWTKDNEKKTPSISHPTDMPHEWMRPDIIELILNQVDNVFQFSSRGMIRRKAFEKLKTILLLMDDAADDWVLRKICWLRNEDTVAYGIRRAQDMLWPNGVFFTKVGDGEETLDQTDPSEETFQMAGQFGGVKVVKPRSLEQLVVDGAKISEKFLLNTTPTCVVQFIWKHLDMTCASDIYYFTQSNLCIKQLAFAILELLVLKVFPELKDDFRDIWANPPHGRSE